MNQFELALQQFKANLSSNTNLRTQNDVASKYIDKKTGRYHPFKSEQIRNNYKQTHPKCISASVIVKCTERPNHHVACNKLLTKIFSK